MSRLQDKEFSNTEIDKGNQNLGAIVEAKGTWSNMPTKFSIFLWRIKNKQINTLHMLNARGFLSRQSASFVIKKLKV